MALVPFMALMLHVGPVTLVALIALVGLGALMALVAPVALVALMGITRFTRFKPVQFTRSNLLHLNISFHIFLKEDILASGGARKSLSATTNF